MERDATEELYVEVGLLQRARAGLAYGGERLGQHVLEGLARRELLAQRGGPAAELVVREGSRLRLQAVDLIDDLAEPPDLCLVAVDEAEQLGKRAQSATAR